MPAGGDEGIGAAAGLSSAGTCSAVGAAATAGAVLGGVALAGRTGAMPNSVCLRRGLSARGGDDAVAVGGADDVAGGDEGAMGGADGCSLATGGSERDGITGARPSSVCLRRGLSDAVVSSASAAAGAGAGTDARATGGAEDAGRGAAGTGVGRRGAGSGVDRLATGGADARGAAGGSGGGAPAAVALDSGRRAGAGMSSSAPHSESMSSVGGAMEGRGGLALTRSLSDRLSVIALPSPFHGSARKSSAQRRHAGQTCKMATPVAYLSVAAAARSPGAGGRASYSSRVAPESRCFSKSPRVPKPPSALSFWRYSLCARRSSSSA